MNPLTAGLAVVVVVHGRPGRKCPQARMFKQAAEFCARDGRTKEPVNSTGRDYQPAMYATAKAQTCDRCGKVQMHNEAHAPAWRGRTLRQVLARMRHDGCGGRAGRAELLTGIEGVSSRPVPRPPSRDATRLSLASEAQYIRSEIGYLVPT